MSIYVLQKDMPNLSKGSELIKADNGWYYVDRDNFGMYFSLFNKVVENNTEWFKLKEESVKVLDIINDGYTATFVKKHHLKVTLNRLIPSTQLPKVKEAIERVLNNEGYEKKYSIQDMEKCWLASRLQLNTKGLGDVVFTFKGFIDKNYVEDYK